MRLLKIGFLAGLSAAVGLSIGLYALYVDHGPHSDVAYIMTLLALEFIAMGLIYLLPAYVAAFKKFPAVCSSVCRKYPLGMDTAWLDTGPRLGAHA